MVNYFEALKYPFLDKKNFILGFILGSMWFFIFPAFLVFGYLIEVIRETLQNNNRPPIFFSSKGWKTLLKNGLSFAVIVSIYLMPPLLLTIASTAVIGDPTYSFIAGEIPKFDALGISLFSMSVLFMLIAIFFMPIAIVLYAASENLRYAISINEILPRLKRVILPYLHVHVASILLFFGIIMIMAIPLLNAFLWIIMGGLFFYQLVFSSRLFAGIFRDYGL